ncbi:hypothetical protein EV384_4687 [Micromonospora kangleipakensis]|uniref:Uncharacterized protein n=1 Tax=Micromonospora kangleipakensis TaxID=1077942 RepID=A0A4Q8BDU2_9ACTN|nr:hypothetical protein [Micromonospora kangleipakensis]RZU76082.1 hypothetical protein EV384_4687 [Micromonospora kangleipakensis]
MVLALLDVVALTEPNLFANRAGVGMGILLLAGLVRAAARGVAAGTSGPPARKR